MVRTKKKKRQGKSLRRMTSIADKLRIAILSGDFVPGEALRENLLAQKFRTSRIPIREALIMLQEQGLVTRSEEQRGCRVVQLSSDDIQSINDVRLVLEAEAVWLARKNMSQELEVKLRDIIERMASTSNPLFDSPVLDLEFHTAIWNASGNPFLVAALNPLVSRLFAFRAITHRISASASSKKVRQKMQTERVAHHRELLKVLLGSSVVDPTEAVHKHIASAFNPPKMFGSLVGPQKAERAKKTIGGRRPKLASH